MRAQATLVSGLDWRRSLRETWARRGALGLLVRRDLRTRFRPARLGALWGFAKPLIVAGVLTVSVGEALGHRGPERAQYALGTLFALVPFGFFQQAYSAGASALFVNQGIVTRLPGPKLFVVLAAVVVAGFDAVVNAGVALGLAAALGVVSPFGAFLLLAALTLAGLMGLGAATLTAAFAPRHRDALFAVPTVSQLLIYATPVAYKLGDVGDGMRRVLGLNPLTWAVEVARAAVTKGPLPAEVAWNALETGAAALVLAVVATGIFIARESRFADHL